MAAKTASLSVNIIADAAKARAGLKEAETAFGKFRREVNESQGAMGKFQTISGSAFDYVKQNAVNFAAAAGAAILAFAVKSVNAFQDLALASGKFADSTGLTVENASRFIEVAGDIGVEAGTVEKALGFMNKTLGNSPQLFEFLGVEIARTADGSTDVAATFLNIVDRLNAIQDPAARAALATKLLGRGWMEMSELIGLGSDELSKSLASVSDAKVINEEELRKAREFRGAMDNLSDRFEDLTIQIGSELVPALTDSIVVLMEMADVIGQMPVLPDIFKNIFKPGVNPFQATALALIDFAAGFAGGEEATINLDDAVFKLGGGLSDTKRAIDGTKLSSQLLGDEMGNLVYDVEGATEAWKIFKDGLNIKAQSIRLNEDIDAFALKWAGTTEEAKRKSREYQLELIAIQTELANVALSIAGVATTSQTSRIRFMIDSGDLSLLRQAKSLMDAIAAGMNSLAGSVTPDRVERILGQGPPPPPPPPGGGGGSTKKTTTTTTQKKTGVQPAATFGGKKIETKRYAGLAAGGTLLSSGGVIVGEFGPELLNLPRGASVTPNIPQRMANGGQTIINIQVQAGLVSSPDQVGAQIIDAIRRAERRSGQVFASV